MNESTDRAGSPPAWVPQPEAGPAPGNHGGTAVHENGPPPPHVGPARPTPQRPPWRIPTDPPPV